MQLLFTDSTEITETSWERIVHSLITYADSIWMNAHMKLSERIPLFLRNHYQKTFNELIEANLIKLWDFEEYMDEESKLKTVIATNESSDLYDAITSQITHYSTYESIGRKDVIGSEITSKIIQYKHELWNIGIAKIIDASGICYPCEQNKHSGSISNYYKYEIINRKYTERLFSKFEIKPLGFLPSSDIMELKKYSNILVKELSKYINKKLPEIPPSNFILEKECQELFENCQNELNNLIKEKSLRRFGIEITKDAAITSIGTFFPLISVVSFGDKFYKLFKDKGKYALLIFALDVKNKAYKSYQESMKNNSEVIKFLS
jgi:hypothetical protein